MNKNSSTCQWIPKHFEVTLVLIPLTCVLLRTDVNIPSKLISCVRFPEAHNAWWCNSNEPWPAQFLLELVDNQVREYPKRMWPNYSVSQISANWDSVVCSIHNKRVFIFHQWQPPLWKCSSYRPLSLAGNMCAHPNHKYDQTGLFVISDTMNGPYFRARTIFSKQFNRWFLCYL